MKLQHSFPVNQIDFMLLFDDAGLIVCFSQKQRKVLIFNRQTNTVVFKFKSWLPIREISIQNDLDRLFMISDLCTVSSFIKRNIRGMKEFLLKKHTIAAPTSTISIFNFRKQQLIRRIHFKDRAATTVCVCDNDGKQVIISRYKYDQYFSAIENPVEIWDNNIQNIQHTIFMPGENEDFESMLSPDKKTVATSAPYNLYLWSLSDKKIIFNLQKDKAFIQSCMASFEILTYSFAVDSKTIAIAFHFYGENIEQHVCIYEIEENILYLKGWYCPFYTTSVAISNKRGYLGVIAYNEEGNKCFILYKTDSKQEILRYEDESLLQVAFSNKDEIILCSTSSIKTWSIF